MFDGRARCYRLVSWVPSCHHYETVREVGRAKDDETDDHDGSKSGKCHTKAIIIQLSVINLADVVPEMNK